LKEYIINRKEEAKNSKDKLNPDWRMINKDFTDFAFKIDGKKTELREWVLIASVDPYVVLFHPGYSRNHWHKHKTELTGNLTKDK
jgi:hypothetical protein